MFGKFSRTISCVLGCNCTLLNQTLSAVSEPLESAVNAIKICDRSDSNCSAALKKLLKNTESNLMNARTYLDKTIIDCKCSHG